jgi:hypothetical protein
MTTTPTVQPGASVWAVRSRLTPTDAQGNLIPGSGSFVTKTLVKATMTPVYATGDKIEIKGADGELQVYAIHGDIPEWYTGNIEIALPDPNLEALITGGTVYNDTTAALGTPTEPTVATETTGGLLAAGTYSYSAAAYSAYGRSLNSTPLAAQTTTGSTSVVVVTPVWLGTELGQAIYGRAVGAGYQQQIGKVQNFSGQATSGSTSGTVTSVAVTALTKAIPAGATFEITGDTNTPKVIFTAATASTNGQTSVAVNSVTVTTPIAAAAIVPVFVDTGVIKPSGLPNTVDRSGGPGLNVGYQTAAMGTTSNPNGFALEMWEKRIINGVQATDLPYWWHVWPRQANYHIMPRDFTNANLATIMEGNGFENPNFGAGPNGDFPFDGTKAYQRFACGADVVPDASFAAVSADF